MTSEQLDRLEVERARSFVSARLLTALALVAIVALGLYLRWSRLDYAEFSYDQAWSLNRAYDFVNEGDFPFAGEITSVGAQHGPTEIFMLAIPAALSKDPRVATGFVALLQMLAVVGTYFFAARYFGRTTGLVAAALYTVNPWAMQFARKLWPPDMMPIITFLFFASLYAAVVLRRRYLLTVSCVLLTALVLTHPAGILYAPLLLLVVAIFWRRLGWRPLALGAVLGLLVLAPYLYHDYQRDFTSLQRFRGAATNPDVRIDLEGLNQITLIASDGGLRVLLPSLFGDNYLIPALGSLDTLANALLALGLAVCALRFWTRRSWRGRAATGGWEPYLLLLLWFATPVLLTLRHSSTMVQTPYFILAWPVQFILIGLALSAGLDLGERLLAGRLANARLWAGAGVVVVVLALGATQFSYAQTYLENLEHPEPETSWGVPLVYAERAVATARDLNSRLGPAPVYVFCSYNQWAGLHYLARPSLSLDRVEPPRQLVLPRDLSAGAILLIAANDGADKPLGFAALDDTSPIIRAAHELGFVDLPDRTIRGAGSVVYFRFLYLSPEKGAEVGSLFRQPEQRLELANGLRLVGYRHPAALRPGEKLTLSLLWEMPADPLSQEWLDYVVFAHAADRTDAVLAQKDWDLFQYRLFQRADDYMVTEYELEVPADAGPGLTWLELGAYEHYSREQVRWLNANGEQMSAAYRVGPIKVSRAVGASQPQAAASFPFGEALELAGYDLGPARPAAGGAVDLTLYWRAHAKPAGDYTVSVQVLDESGNLVAQHDSPPVGGNYPTSYWEAGETVLDRHTIELPKDVGPGVYRVLVVVYSPQTQQRLPVDGADAAPLTTLRLK